MVDSLAVPDPAAALSVPAAVRFQLFGTVGVLRDGRPLDVGPRQARCLLAMLLLAKGWVSRDELMGALWDDPSDTAREDFYKLVGKLKKVLAQAGLPGALESRDGLYRLRTPAGSVDVERFRALVNGAARADDRRAAELLEEALRIASAEPMADLVGLRVDARRQSLVEERKQARVELERVSLRLGRHHARIPHLKAEFARDPGDETVAGLLMAALYLAGRQKEAVEVYHRVREYIRETAGLDVGPDLAHLYQQMISSDPRLHIVGSARERSASPPGDTPGEKAEETSEKEPEEEQAPETPHIHNEFHEKVDARGATFGVVQNYHGRRRR
ncbi:BTAD domain-containing putative transcriptional regulator [Actinomadura sp. NBRC 104425]|uniref:AfsR/SARP family transcriptional regulator n=1 Tax=Actinomadura sp. NBRC 104425 TaxID=3032204 RepID=UPI0025565097|nr:BTAD domain-containing putative transcriptional regulator [Actinomadura sp. NBRC 104425]